MPSPTIEVRIPTILRPYTNSEKVVTAEANNLGELITALNVKYAGLGERLLENNELRRFINIYIS